MCEQERGVCLGITVPARASDVAGLAAPEN